MKHPRSRAGEPPAAAAFRPVVCTPLISLSLGALYLLAGHVLSLSLLCRNAAVFPEKYGFSGASPCPVLRLMSGSSCPVAAEDAPGATVQVGSEHEAAFSFSFRKKLGRRELL